MSLSGLSFIYLDPCAVANMSGTENARGGAQNDPCAHMEAADRESGILFRQSKNLQDVFHISAGRGGVFKRRARIGTEQCERALPAVRVSFGDWPSAG